MTGRRSSARLPRSVYARGSEPDPRFSLANERTFLAWIRTALAFLAAGVALEALAVPIDPGFRLAASAVFVVLGMLASLQAWVGWFRVERAMREGRALPPLTIGSVIAVGLLLAILLVAIGLLV
ncbi:protein of unknown function DUF202 [Serinicoccus hydrothermalis]|uniref:DUF202 domain-containing protein n=1 Tax=Serinicoccus hydrothermalis TaxID=1758689 RepID=A0A1B1NAS4_9MICO|nr:DUF202 domain-containing protein [Serinicoccus hydrothermalis]ANS78504.1 protein of unknown function DUF202 [Serinicoccus hydrothermalis]